MKRSLCDVFGNPVRVKLICCLSGRAKNVSELVGKCDLSQSAISQHLAILRDAGAVGVKRIGKEMWYEVSSKHILEICKKIESILKEEHHV